MGILTVIGALVLWGPPENPLTLVGEEMREYRERWSDRPIRVGATWMFGSGN
jgi:hypothetical protein